MKLSTIRNVILIIVSSIVAIIVCAVPVNTHALAEDRLPVPLTITLSSNPTSGTSNNPKSLSISTDIVYSIEITNTSPDSISNIVINDNIPEGLHIADSSISYYTGNDIGTSKLVSESDTIDYSANGNSATFTIDLLDAGSSITLYVPTVVNTTDTNEVLFTNKANVTSFNGFEADIQSTSTYHTYTGGVNSTLPELRGSGNLPFIVMGIAIMGAAAVLMIVTFRRRHRKSAK